VSRRRKDETPESHKLLDESERDYFLGLLAKIRDGKRKWMSRNDAGDLHMMLTRFYFPRSGEIPKTRARRDVEWLRAQFVYRREVEREVDRMERLGVTPEGGRKQAAYRKIASKHGLKNARALQDALKPSRNRWKRPD
jgi:hypothetical protein